MMVRGRNRFAIGKNIGRLGRRQREIISRMKGTW
jgi:hypothetical protein